MKLRAVAIAAVLGLACPAVDHADLILPPEPSSKPLADPPPSTPASDSGSDATDGAKDPSAPEPSAGPTGDAPTDPTSSLQAPPQGGCASCRVVAPPTESGALPLLFAAIAAVVALQRRR